MGLVSAFSKTTYTGYELFVQFSDKVSASYEEFIVLVAIFTSLFSSCPTCIIAGCVYDNFRDFKQSIKSFVLKRLIDALI